jgi:hypothetical protein
VTTPSAILRSRAVIGMSAITSGKFRAALKGPSLIFVFSIGRRSFLNRESLLISHKLQRLAIRCVGLFARAWLCLILLLPTAAVAFLQPEGYGREPTLYLPYFGYPKYYWL